MQKSSKHGLVQCEVAYVEGDDIDGVCVGVMYWLSAFGARGD